MRWNVSDRGAGLVEAAFDRGAPDEPTRDYGDDADDADDTTGPPPRPVRR
jgi:hypothetical protein